MENFNLEIESGSFTVLVGPSGCGKTTLIRLISGLEPCTEGAVWIAGKDVTRHEPGERGVAVVFQNYALYPHMTVEKNISFGLRNFGYKKDEIKRILAEVLDLVGLTEYAHEKPAGLSGGQKQRVALARAISKSPDVFLMDEPLSNL
ncbi:MAG: ABC transporter ATP-binding protein, partial [Synergistaceae bacterium]|nr:ABC transporter ATP-binding protein [Synergistaceae bacterium]